MQTVPTDSTLQHVTKCCEKSVSACAMLTFAAFPASSTVHLLTWKRSLCSSLLEVSGFEVNEEDTVDVLRQRVAEVWKEPILPRNVCDPRQRFTLKSDSGKVM